MNLPPAPRRGTVLPLVPARGGSERLPDKNLSEVGGVPLLVRAVRVALAAFGRCVVSTDRPDYAALAESHGAEVPALRPPQLAGSEVPMDEVARHAARTWARRETILVVVQPTSPFLEAGDLQALTRVLRAPVVSAVLATRAAPTDAFLLVEAEPGKARPAAPELFPLRTQDVPPLWRPTGGAFAAAVDHLRRGGDLVTPPVAVVEVPPERALEVDDAADLARAREAAG